jgi:hypothetical protein
MEFSRFGGRLPAPAAPWSSGRRERDVTQAWRASLYPGRYD